MAVAMRCDGGVMAMTITIAIATAIVSLLTSVGLSIDHSIAMATSLSTAATGLARTSTQTVIDYELLARRVIREGKPFKTAAIEAGYAETSAHRGLKAAMADSSLLTEAIKKEWMRLETDVTRLKPVAVARLYREIADPNSPQGIRAIEVAGKFKEADWFVRQVGDIQIGIVNAIGEVPETATLAEYKEDPPEST